MRYLPDYIRLEDLGSQPFTNEYHTHIFLRNEAENAWLNKSQAWYTVYENGTPKVKWIQKPGHEKTIFEDVDQGIPIFEMGKPEDYPDHVPSTAMPKSA